MMVLDGIDAELGVLRTGVSCVKGFDGSEEPSDSIA
ncbi:Uncharacterised protein [Streptococcus pneumoniae]|nr:Uncharacterised protein [Streptococcus pneumoniae]